MITLAIASLLITALQNERQSAANELKDAFERINKVASRLPGLVVQYRIRPDRSSSVPYASNAIFNMFEISPEDVRHDARPLFARIDASDIETGKERFRQAANELAPWQKEFRLVLVGRKSAPDFTERFTDLLLNPNQFDSPGYQELFSVMETVVGTEWYIVEEEKGNNFDFSRRAIEKLRKIGK